MLDSIQGRSRWSRIRRASGGAAIGMAGRVRACVASRAMTRGASPRRLQRFADGAASWNRHRAQKATWLYAVGVHPLPMLQWGKATGGVRLDDGFHSAEERRRAIRTGICQRLSKRERAETPLMFRDLLLGIAAQAVAAVDPQVASPGNPSTRAKHK
jgi:hypothetical protein